MTRSVAAATTTARAREKARLEKEKEKTRLAKEQAREKARLEKEKERLRKEKEKERLRKEKEREKARLEKEKERARKEKEREKARLEKEKEKERLAREKEKERARKEKEKEQERARKEKEKEQERARKEKEREKVRLEKEKERLAREKEKERARKEKEREKARIAKEKEKERARKEKEKEQERARKEKEREKARIAKEKEQERLRKEKEAEAYKKARAAERERVRAEKEAARRALEGRVAQQQRRAARIAGTTRGSSSRVYRPDAIPSQAGTRREGLGSARVPAHIQARSPLRSAAVLPPPRPAPPQALDARWASILERLARMPEKFQREYAESFDMSWIHHDSALEGVVYTYQELKTAVDPNIVIVPDSSLQPVCEEIRRHKRALEWARQLGKEDSPLSAEILKRLLLLLHPEEGDLKSVKYRKEIPQHRLYFHDYAPPDKIAVRVRQAFDWLHGPEPPKLKDPVRVAARLHFDLLRTFPFPQDSGKVARLLMNILLMRANLPPVIVHSTERQRYYDALRGSLPTIILMINDSMRNAMASIEKVLDEEEDG